MADRALRSHLPIPPGPSASRLLRTGFVVEREQRGDGSRDPALAGERPLAEQANAPTDAVLRLYRELLLRDPDPGERQAGEREGAVDLALRLVASREYRAIVENARYRVLIDLFRANLGLQPLTDPAIPARERRSLVDVAQELTNLVGTTRPSKVATEPRGGISEEEIARLYRELLGREPHSREEIGLWKGKPILDTALDFARSAEHRARVRGAEEEDVTRFYREFLGREPTPERDPQWRGVSIDKLALTIAKSEEATRRQAIGFFLNPENLRRLHAIFEPDSLAADEWYTRFARIIGVHEHGIAEVVEYLYSLFLNNHGTPLENDAISRSIIWKNQKLENIGSRVTLVVPTINSEKWLGHVIDFYGALGVSVLFALDTRSSDGTRDLLSARSARFIEVSGEHRRLESVMPDILAKVDSEWILRVDDDELPTPGLLEFVDQAVRYSAQYVWSFPRAELRYDAQIGTLQYSQFISFGSLAHGLHPLAHVFQNLHDRLFTRRGIELRDLLHTPGFVPKMPRTSRPDALIFHFDWVLRSLAERIEKLRSYEAQDFKRARAAYHCALYETVPESWHMWAPVRDERYASFAKRIYRATRAEPETEPAARHKWVSQDRREGAASSRRRGQGAAGGGNNAALVSAFWHGPPLSPMTWACLSSFIAYGQQVDLYTYDDFAVPNGVTRRDAAEIIPRDQLFYFRNPISGVADISPFTDVFRFRLLRDRGGWWVDVDVVCNQAAIPECRYAWATESAEENSYIGSSQIKFPKDDPIVRRLHEEAVRLASGVRSREETGPELLTSMLGESPTPEGHFGTMETFYPLSWVEGFKLWLPEFREEVLAKTRASVFVACWASLLRYMGIDDERLPPPGSHMANLIQKFAPMMTENRSAYSAEEVRILVRRWLVGKEWAEKELRCTTAPELLAQLGLA